MAQSIERAPKAQVTAASIEPEIRAAMEKAMEMRTMLGLDPDHAYPGDPWKLAVFLREDVEIEIGPVSSCIYYREGKPDRIRIEEGLGAWEEAFHLAHELGHFLCTQPTPEELRIWRETLEAIRAYPVGHPEREAAKGRFLATDDRAELLANSFSLAFMLGSRWHSGPDGQGGCRQFIE